MPNGYPKRGRCSWCRSAELVWHRSDTEYVFWCYGSYCRRCTKWINNDDDIWSLFYKLLEIDPTMTSELFALTGTQLDDNIEVGRVAAGHIMDFLGHW